MKRVAVIALAICVATLTQVRRSEPGTTTPEKVAKQAAAPDLSKVDRRIAKEPRYTSKEPLYGLYVLGPKATTRIWAVLDKSRVDAPAYDVLYFDRNATAPCGSQKTQFPEKPSFVSSFPETRASIRARPSSKSS